MRYRITPTPCIFACAPPVGSGPRAEGTGVADAGEGATLIDGAAAPTLNAAAAKTVEAAGAAPTRADARVGETDSVVTRVAPQPHVPPPSRSGSRLALGVAAGVFALSLVGVGVYSLTGGFEGPVGVPAGPQTLQQTQAAPTAESTPAEAREAEVPAPERVVSPDAPRRVTPAATTTARGSKPRAEDAQ